MIENLLAKSLEKKQKIDSNLPNSKRLFEHSVAVTHLARFIADKMLLKDSDAYTDTNKYSDSSIINREKIINDVTIAAALHDIGKCNGNIQEFLKNPIKKNGYYIDNDECLEPIPNKKDSVSHSILSFAYLKHNTSLSNNTAVLKSILFHHPIHVINEDKHTITVNDDLINIEMYNSFLTRINDFLREKYDISLTQEKKSIGNKISDVKLYDICGLNIENMIGESVNMLTRTCVLCADRIISSLSQEDSFERACDNDVYLFEEIFNFKLINTNIKKNVELNSLNIDLKRFETQLNVLSDISGFKHVNFFGSAGFGKTLFGTKWGLDRGKKLMWVTPTNTIARNVYTEIKEDLIKLNQTDVTVSLLLTGKYEEGDAGEHADIIVTNIDNFLSVIHKNNVCDKMLNLYGCNVVFDEYHDFVNSKPMFSAFLKTLFTRVNFTNCETLLLSATPLPIEKYINLGDNKIEFYKKTPILHADTVINVSFEEKSKVEDIELKHKDAFYFFNSVTQTQRLKDKYVDDENVNILHACFTKERRTQIEDLLFNVHGKKSVIENRNTWFGTSLIGTSVNISGKHLYDSPITPEDTIQHQGRGARFGEKEYGNEINYTLIKFKDEYGTKRLTSEIYTKELNKKWFDKVKEYDGKQTTRGHFYTMYFDFYEQNMDEYETFLKRIYVDSENLLSEIKLRKISNVKKDDKINNNLSNVLSLRGVNDSIYVIANQKDGALSSPIVLRKTRITKEEEYDEALKIRAKFMRSHTDEKGTYYYNKYVKQIKPIMEGHSKIATVKTLETVALSDKSPFLLCNAVYDDVLGLQIIKNSDSICDIDD